MVAIAVCSALALMVVVALVAAWWLGRSSLVDSLARRSVLVTLAEDEGFEGILWAVDKTGLLLVPGAGGKIGYWRPGADEVEPIDRGDVFVPADRVMFVQLLRAGG